MVVERDGNGLVICCTCHQQHYQELPSGGPPDGRRKKGRPKETWRRTVKEMKDKLHMGSPGMTSKDPTEAQGLCVSKLEEDYPNLKEINNTKANHKRHENGL